MSARSSLSLSLATIFAFQAFAIADTNLKCTKLTEPFRYENLKALVKKCKIKSVDQLLEYLPTSYWENFTLIYNSRSGQAEAIDPLNPRVVLYGKDARLILAFTGNPSKSKYDNLEIIQYRSDTASFDFKEIDFSGETKKLGIDSKSQRSTPFNEKPATCAGCHRSDSRPNWDPYNFWPGVYAGMPTGVKSDTKEAEYFSEFLKTKSTQGRYAYISQENYKKFFKKLFTPNLKLSVHAAFLNYHRILRLMRESKDFNHFKYAVAAALTDCPNIESFVEATDKENYPTSFDALLDATKKAKKENFQTRLTRLNDISDAPLTLPETLGEHIESDDDNSYNTDHIAKLRYVLQPHKVQIEDWSMNFDPDAYSFTDGKGNLKTNFLTLFLYEELFTTDPDLKKFYKLIKDSSGDDEYEMDAIGYPDGGFYSAGKLEDSKVCSVLREKSLSAFSK